MFKTKEQFGMDEAFPALSIIHSIMAYKSFFIITENSMAAVRFEINIQSVDLLTSIPINRIKFHNFMFKFY
jgi:hypothetical protein